MTLLSRPSTTVAVQVAQLREDYDKFVEKDAEILVIGPEGPRRFKGV